MIDLTCGVRLKLWPLFLAAFVWLSFSGCTPSTIYLGYSIDLTGPNSSAKDLRPQLDQLLPGKEFKFMGKPKVSENCTVRSLNSFEAYLVAICVNDKNILLVAEYTSIDEKNIERNFSEDLNHPLNKRVGREHKELLNRIVELLDREHAAHTSPKLIQVDPKSYIKWNY